MREREERMMLWENGRYQGHVSAALVLGGVDAEGAHIYTVYPHGSVDRLPYAAMGSGELCAMSVFESGYKEDLDVSRIDDVGGWMVGWLTQRDRRKRRSIWLTRPFSLESLTILAVEATWIFASSLNPKE